MLSNYALEIDFLPVGEGSRSGDAIAFRIGLVENGQWKNQKVFVIDGGNSFSGSEIVKHVQNVYDTNKVERVILTHPDADHASGLRTVINQLEVGKIWMHRPWNYWEDIKNSIVDGRITKKSFGERMREAYQFAHDVEQLAFQKKIPIFPPHQGSNYNIDSEPILTVLGPSKELYLNLIQASGKTPEMGIFESTRMFTSKISTIEYEDMRIETENLADTDIPTSPENDMSLILLLKIAGSKVLFTGDAGTQGLYKALQYSALKDISLMDLDIFDVPHHGSRRNLSKGILKYIHSKHAVISCSKEGTPKHPSPIVTNALLRRGMSPYATQGGLVNYHSSNIPSRLNLITLSPLPFQNKVEISH